MPDEISPDADAIRLQQFQLGMSRTTPTVFVTPALIAINVAVFVLMAINGLSLTDPGIAGLIRWGADFGPLTTHGQWWRLVTAAFVHIGVIHILMNMYILFSIGMFVERLYGNVAFAVLYLLAAIGGNLVSVAWQPFTVAAGASGAVFGVYGGLLGFLLLQRHAIPGRTVASLFKGAAIFLGYNLIYSAANAHIDMAAHVGGFVSGFLAGCALAQPFSASQDSRRARSAAVLLAGLALSAACAWKIPVVDNLDAELKHLSTVEDSTVKTFNDALDQVKADRMAAPAFDDIVGKQLLPPWNAEKASLQKLRLSGPQKALAARLVQYMSLRAEGWSLTAQGFRESDSSLIQQANEKQKQAEQIVAPDNK